MKQSHRETPVRRAIRTLVARTQDPAVGDAQARLVDHDCFPTDYDVQPTPNSPSDALPSAIPTVTISPSVLGSTSTRIYESIIFRPTIAFSITQCEQP